MPYNTKYDTHKILYVEIGKNDKIKTAQVKFKKSILIKVNMNLAMSLV